MDIENQNCNRICLINLVSRKINGFEGKTLSNNFRTDQPIALRGVYFRDVKPRRNGITLVGERVAALMIAASLALFAVVLYMAMITLVD